MRKLATAMIGLLALAAAEGAPGAAVAQRWPDEIAYRDDRPRGDDWRGGRDFDHRRGPGSDRGYGGRHDPDGDRGYRGRGGYGRGYDGYGYRGGGRRGDGYGRRGRRCRDDGTGGTIIGAIAGGLLGNQVAGRGDRALGTIIGGGAGALGGRAIDRDCR